MHIVEKDGIKCVAYVRAFLRVYVDYYEYRNPLITGDEVLLLITLEKADLIHLLMVTNMIV